MRPLVTTTIRSIRGDLPLRTHLSAATVLALVVILLRMPGFGAPLGIDEGGMTPIGSDWLRNIANGTHGDSLYGDLWVDRPPLILALYGAANLVGGAFGVRILGLVAALVAAILAGSVAERLGGRRAWLPASLITGVLLSTPSIDGDRTPGELLAAVPAAIAVCLLAGVALSDRRRRLGLVATDETPARGIGAMRIGRWHRVLLIGGAGAAAACAPLIKQSALDGCLAAACWFAYRAIADRGVARNGRAVLRDISVFTIGALAASGITVGLALRAGTSFDDLTYALIGFRVDVLVALTEQSSSPAERATRLLAPAAASGLVVVVLFAPIGMWLAARRGPLAGAGAALLAGWLLGASIGVAGGGYYWAHYLIQLVPPIGVATGIVLATRRAWAPTTLIALLILVASAGQFVRHQAIVLPEIAQAGFRAGDQQAVVAIGDFVRRNSLSDDRVAVVYARANVAYYAQRQPATSFMWCSMYRALPDAREQLRASLTGPDRAAWIVQWNSTKAYGLDRDGSLKAAIDSGYRRVTVMCSKPILLRRDRELPSVVMPTEHCPAAGPQRVFGDVPVATGFTRG
ncbi:MAG: hypothetical protein H7287_09445 [Thermoleophilia bacterium]|nr:hypothetical protein [Thermoleophilia bacterium]